MKSSLDVLKLHNMGWFKRVFWTTWYYWGCYLLHCLLMNIFTIIFVDEKYTSMNWSSEFIVLIHTLIYQYVWYLEYNGFNSWVVLLGTKCDFICGSSPLWGLLNNQSHNDNYGVFFPQKIKSNKFLFPSLWAFGAFCFFLHEHLEHLYFLLCEHLELFVSFFMSVWSFCFLLCEHLEHFCFLLHEHFETFCFLLSFWAFGAFWFPSSWAFRNVLFPSFFLSVWSILVSFFANVWSIFLFLSLWALQVLWVQTS